MNVDDRRLIDGLRDLRDAGDIVVIVHDCDGIDRHLLWDTAIRAVPRVTQHADALIRELGGA